MELRGRGLTREGFEALLQRLDPDRDRAGEAYEALRRRMLKFFEWRGASRPEELTDETIDRVCSRIAAGEEIRAEDPGRYFHGVARNVLRESWKREPEAPLNEERLPGGLTSPLEGQTSLDERRSGCLQSCLDALPPETARLLLDYYRESGGTKIGRRRDLAAVLGIGPVALRLRLHRLRGRLEACVRHCLERPETEGPSGPLEGEGGRP